MKSAKQEPKSIDVGNALDNELAARNMSDSEEDDDFGSSINEEVKS